ncbi:MAG: translocation/assembly module TamB domain-containing protein, partial [Leptolyngbyaceae bacterium]|nr:translocation/assembly module TamB domain-containing protein [Leptolyngbyaceae bacterium]
QAALNWNVTGGSFPARGTVAYADQILRARNTIIQVEPGSVPNFAAAEATLTASANAFLAEQRWDAQINAEGIDLSAILPQVEQGRASSDLSLTGTLDRANVVGTVRLSDGLAGTITTNANASLVENRWDAQVNVDGVAVNPLVPQLDGRLTSHLTLTGLLDQLNPAGVNITGSATLADALVTLSPDTPPILDRGDWTTAFEWLGTGLAVERFVAPGLQADGLITTNLQGDLTPEAIVEDIHLNVTVAPYDLERLQAFVPADLKAQLAAQISPYTDTSIYPEGFVEFQGQLTGNLAQLQLDGTTQLENLAIANLTFARTLSGAVNFGLGQGGGVDLTGGGDRIYARLNERYLPTDFEIRASEFVATGTLAEGDRLTAAIENFDLVTLGIRPLPRPDLGPVQGRVNLNLAANLADLANPRVDGKVAIAQPGLGTVAANVFTGTFNYSDGIASLTDGFFCIGPGDADLSTPNPNSTPDPPPTPGELCANTSTFRLAAVVDVFNVEIQSSQLVIEAAQLQDFLTTLQWYDIDDAIQWLDFNAPTLAASLGSSEDIELEAIALSDSPLITTAPNAPLISNDPDTPPLYLRGTATGQLPEFEQWLAQWTQAQANPQFTLPSLETLDGQFDGTITLAGSPSKGFSVDFDLEGQQWTWAPYLEAGVFTAKGSATPDIITFDQFQFRTESALIALGGEMGLTQPGRSTLVVSNVPVPLLQGFAQQFVPQLQNAPVVLDGTLETNIVLEGTVFNPRVEGVVQVDQPSLNQQPLEQAAIQFGYNQTDLSLDHQARLTLDGAIALRDQERLTIRGQVPYALPFMSVQPITDEIAVNVNIRDEGFKLINLFTQGQVVWDGGTGVMDVGISGTLAQPQIGGTLALQSGQISSPFLTQPITGIAGAAAFDLNQLDITEPFVVQLGRGTVTIAGQLPVFAPAADSATPRELAIALNTLPLPLKNLLSAQVDGAITVGGTAIAPIIGGRVNVSDGQVDVAGVLAAAGGKGNNRASLEVEAVPNPLLEQITLDQLAIMLDNELQISYRPLFDLNVRGDLTASGTLAQPIADGDIELSSGWINLFSNQFLLDRSEENIVRFRPNRPLMDPDLHIVIRSGIREVDRRPIAPSSPFAIAEVIDQSTIPTFGGLQFVVVTAKVDGSAQNLLDHLADPNSPSPNPLTLTSDPERSEQQIVALLGGQLFNALEGGNAGVAIASYIGSGLIADLGNQVVDALGLTEFNIFPTNDVSGEARLPIAIGIEAAIDLIPRRLSFSVLEVLDGTTNPQFGLRYQISDDWQIRGSSDLNDDNRAILEFRTNF